MYIPKLQELNHLLIEDATLVENMIEKSIKGLLDKRRELLNEVIEQDEPKANNYDRTIDELCSTIIAQFEPMARDLRLVITILKMNKDLERMADHAVNISESGLFLIERPFAASLENIKSMAETTTKMVKDSISSFINGNVMQATSVFRMDSIVDSLGDTILLEMTDVIRGKKDVDVIKRALHVMRISHNLERISDISTNICEEVIYAVEGKDTKHHKDDSLEGPHI